MSERLFDPSLPLSRLTSAAQDRIRSVVQGAAEDDVLAADPEEWGARVAASETLEPPLVHLDQVAYEDLGPVRVDCTNMPGITFTTSEWGRRIMRDGRKFLIRVPVSGRADLLSHSAQGVPHPKIGGHVQGQEAIATEEWPLVKGEQALEAEFQQYLNMLRADAEAITRHVEQFNANLPEFAAATVRERQEYIHKHRGFLDSLTISVARRQDAPRQFTAPPIERRPKPAIDTSPPKAPASAPKLGEFFDHILDTTRSMGQTMEQAPGSYADKDEETLRDQLLLILNSHYQGQTHAEAFNKLGKSDLLIRVGGETLFIAECKWWGGRKALGKALDQLYRYSTWRDSRLALLIFVGSKDFSRVVATTRETIEQRPEFQAWQPDRGHQAEMRFRARWADDPGRQAGVAVQLFHLPR